MMIAQLFIVALSSTKSAVPMLTAAQLDWQRGEIMALIHFNMPTFFKNGDPGCDESNWDQKVGGKMSSNPYSFAIAADPREENAGASSGRWFLSSKGI